MSDDWLRPLGGTGLVVSAIGAGGGPLGSVPDTFGHGVAADQGVATVRRILAGPITFLDTSNGYGGGESERRIGKALGEVGGMPSGFVLATKVDPGADGSLGAARVRRSVEESLQRLGLERIQLLFLHDPSSPSLSTRRWRRKARSPNSFGSRTKASPGPSVWPAARSP